MEETTGELLTSATLLWRLTSSGAGDATGEMA